MSPLKDRLKRARKLTVVQCDEGPRVVESGGLEFDVDITLDEAGWLVGAHCECEDWRSQDLALNEYPGGAWIAHVDYVPTCKHVLAVLVDRGVIVAE